MCICDCQEFFMLFIMLIYAGIPIVIYIFANPKYDFENNLIVQEIKNSLEGKLIYSLRPSITCESDEEELILGIWDGIIDGCDCEGSIGINKCSKEKIENNCKTIFAIEPKTYTIFNSKFFCAKTSKLQYKDLLNTNQVKSKNEKCPDNYKSCGKIDTLERKLCVKEEESCPLNTNNYENVTNKIYQIFQDDDEAQILSIFKLGQKLPCINPSEKFWDYYYELEHQSQKCSSEIKGKLHDDRYIQIPNIETNKLQLYNDNSITNKLKDIDEKSLNKMKNDIIYLYGRNFFGLEINNNFNYEKLLNNQKNINNSFLAEFYICIGVLITFTVCVIIKANCFKSVKIMPSILDAEIETESLELFLEYLILVFIILIPIIDFILFLIIYINNKSIHSILTFTEFDEYAIEILQNLKDKDLAGNGYYLFMVISCPIILVILLIVFCKFLECCCSNDYYY